MLPDDDDHESAVSTVARILERTPRLETLSLFFLPEPHPHPFPMLADAWAWHELRYNPHARLAVPPDVVEIPCCLRETTMEINLVHYQGSAAQRALAKFLLCNSRRTAAALPRRGWRRRRRAATWPGGGGSPLRVSGKILFVFFFCCVALNVHTIRRPWQQHTP